ncbi:conserved membrane hypothetical protein [Sphingomonas sp. EC-HK361]|jgi:hypothetical protein|nr:conserved membrane hypothetical protein [Sphingomonas sp. EC-HK361]
MFARMLNILSVLIGLVALLFAIPGIIPLLGILNWIAVPIAVVGLIVGMLSSRNTGRNVNIVILLVAIVRLSLGGGIF